MNKKILIPLLISLVLNGCNQSNQGNDNGQNNNTSKESYIVNDFESLNQLGLMKFPFPRHENRGRMELSEEHVTNGNKSLKYYNEYGTSLEMCHYFGHFVENGVNLSDIKSISVDIFNASDYDTICTLYLYDKTDMKTIVREDFNLKHGEMNNINYPISKIVLEHQAEQINASSLRIYTPESSDYDKGIIYTFFIDNWRVNMGSEDTEEDKVNKPIIKQIEDDIKALPDLNVISTSDKDKLEAIANEIDKLSPKYLEYVEGLETYYETLGEYRSQVRRSQPINYDNEEFIGFSKFYGAAELRPDTGVNSNVVYTSKDWDENDSDGLTKIIFSGDEENRFVYKTSLNLNRFDYVSFTLHNDTPYGLKVWFSYLNNVYLDIWPNQTISTRYRTNTISDQTYWNVDVINGGVTNRNLDPFSGSLYFSSSYIKGRSESTLQSQIANALNTIPNASELNTEEDYLHCLTSVVALREILSMVADTSSVSTDQLINVSNIELKAVTNEYSVCYNAYSNPMLPIYGQETHESESGQNDSTFGFVSVSHVTRTINNEQGFKFINSVAISPKYKGYVVYVFNPTDHDVQLFVRNTAGYKWQYWSDPDFELLSHPGWNKLEIKNETIQKLIYENFENAELVIMAHNPDLVGDWKFSSMFGVPRVI